MKIDTEHPFTVAQFNALNQEDRQAILAVVDYLTGSKVDISDEALSEALNLMKPTEGCVPLEEVDDDPVAPIRRKFAAVYQPAMELAEGSDRR